MTTTVLDPGSPPGLAIPPTSGGLFGSDHEPLPPRPGGLGRVARETRLLVGRSLRTIRHVPERLSDVTIQPVIFTLLFVYVFGSAITVPGVRYQDYLLPGLLGQSLAFGVMGSATATATDFSSGVIDRFRSLPIRPVGVITAQVIGQVLEQLLGIAITVALGFAVGWRPELGLTGALALSGVMLLGLVAFTWFGVLIGMVVRSADAVQGVGFAIVLPLSFMAGTFVPIAGMATIPRIIGEWDPLTPFVAAVRQICTGIPETGSWQLEHAIPLTLAWCVAIIAICMPIALRKFRTLSS